MVEIILASIQLLAVLVLLALVWDLHKKERSISASARGLLEEHEVIEYMLTLNPEQIGALGDKVFDARRPA